ncbi:TonB-dependent receptor [Balneolales bacterium ANBcel1]|nr:TonB-dependent receptor [Balneolales bacterium ANBcel1]
MIKKMTSAFAVAFLLVVATNALAQNTGTITGTLIDGSNDETLLGATVMIEGTNRGASTNMEGRFTIRNVQPGEYTLVATYIGYDRVRQDVVVEAGEETEVVIVMDWSGITGEEVIISAQARGQTSAINEQLRSRTIQNIVSSERIRELPDASAATALSRLPGVSLQHGDKIVIRGMQAKLNTVSVNGIQLPSTDQNDRSTNLGFISSNMLDGIDVTKAVTPDMEANATGGAVNLRLREAPSGLKFDALVQGSYNTQDRTYPGENYQMWGSLSDRFFDDRLGVFVQANANRRDGGADIIQANYEFHSAVDGDHVMRVNEINFMDEVNIVSEYGGSVIMDYRLPNGKISLQNTIAHTNSDYVGFRDFLELGASRRSYRINRNDRDRQLLINALQGEYNFSDLQVNFGVSHARSKQETNLRYGDNWDEFYFANSGDAEADFADQNRLEIRFDDFYDIEYREGAWANAIQQGTHFLEEIDFTQRNYTGNLDFTLPVDLGGGVSVEFQTGGRMVITNRDNERDRLKAHDLEIPNHYDEAREWAIERGIDPSRRLRFEDFIDHSYGDGRGDYFFDGRRPMNRVIDVDMMDSFYRALEGAGWPIHESDSQRNDFSLTERITAGYFMGTFDIGTRLTLMAGVRYEHFNMDYDANFVYETHGAYGDVINLERRDPHVLQMADSITTVERDYGHLFPNVQARFSVTDWMDLRAAYTKTISRPDFSMLIPNVFRGAGSGQAGNPFLEPTISNNFDFNVALYNNEIGLFTVGVFYKELTDFFYGINRLNRALPEGINFPEAETWEAMGFSSPAGSYEVSTFMNNPHKAHVHGFEIDWQTNFWYLPAPFNSTVLNVNYTRNFSEMDYRFIRFEEVMDQTVFPPRRILVEEEIVRTGRLLFQGDHIINVALGADYRGFSGRVSFRLQGDVITSVGQRPEADWFDEDVYGWDFSIRQRLPVEGLSMSISGVNITHNPTNTYRYFRRYTDGQLDEQPSNQLTRIRYDARSFEIGLRYDF